MENLDVTGSLSTSGIVTELEEDEAVTEVNEDIYQTLRDT